MVERSASRSRSDALDRTFGALADPTRRAILARLRSGAATISEVAAPFDVSFAAVSKHVQVLERAGLVVRDVVGREHRLALAAAPLRAAADWTAGYREFWESRLDALESFVAHETRAARRPAKPETRRRRR